MSIAGSNVEKSGRFCSPQLVHFFLLLSIGGTAVGVSHCVPDRLSVKQDEMGKLEKEIQYLESATQVERVRHSNVQKIIAIINRYNSNKSSLEKYAIATAIYQASLKYANLDIELICATIAHESSTWNPRARSPAGAMGLMQVMPATGKYVAQYEGIKWTSAEEVLFDPVYNIRIGCRYLSALIEVFKDTEGALAAYNGGQRRASLWMRQDKADGILWEETQNYFQSVSKFAEEFRLMDL